MTYKEESQQRKDLILVKVREIIFEQHEIISTRVQLDSRLNKDLGLDSLDITILIMDLEKAYNISIPDEMIERLFTINGLVEFVWSTIEISKSKK